MSNALALLLLLLPAIYLRPALSGAFVPSFRDQSDFFLPAHRYTAARLAHGELPLWNPLAGNGETWIGNGQNEVFYPPALLFLLKNPALASAGFLILHFAAAYVLLFAWLRERGSTLPAAVAGAALFAFSPVAVSLSAYWNHFAGMVWIPGMAWAADRGLRTRRQRGAFAACLGLALLAGSPEAAAFGTLLATGVFEAGRREDRAKQAGDWRVRVRRWPAFAGAFLAGAALGAVALVPLLDTLTRAGRRTSGAGAIPVRQLLSLVLPPSLRRYGWLPPDASWVQSLYVSLPALLLAAFALVRGGGRRVWGVVAVLALGLSLVPFPGPFRYPAKLLIVVLLALGVLVATGIDRLRFDTRGRLAALLVLAATGAAEALSKAASPAERVALAAAGGLLALSAFGSGDFRAVVSALGAAALAIHLALSASPLVRFARLETFEKPPLPASGKVLTTPDEILSMWATSALPDEDLRVRRQIDSLEGYSNLPFGVAKATTGSALPSRESARFMAGLANRTDFLVPAMVSGSKEIRFPTGNRLSHVVVPRTLAGVSFFPDAEVEPEWRAALYRSMSSGFDPLRKLLVAEKLPNAPRPGAAPGSSRALAVGSTVSERPERLEYKVELSQDLWMYRAQSWDPWWRAKIDGKPAPIVRADGVFSAVVVPKGDHRVVWEYRPWPFYAGAAITAAALATLLFLALAGEPIVTTRRA